MEPAVLNRMIAVLRMPASEDARQECLQLAEPLGAVVKDLRESFAYAVTEKLFPGDAKLVAAFAPYRKDAARPDAIIERLRTILNAFATACNPLAKYPECFDLCAWLSLRLQGEPKEWAEPKCLADLALRYAHAQTADSARKPLANWLYTPRGELSPAATAMLAAPTPEWVKEKFDAAIGDVKPKPAEGRRVWRASKDRLAGAWKAVREFQPAAVLTLFAISFALVLFVVAMATNSASDRSGFTMQVNVPPPPPPVMPPPAPPTVYEQLTKRLKEKQDVLAGAVFVVSPRARDGADARLVEAITRADLKDVTVVPWAETRVALGGDVPAFGRWLTTAEIDRLTRVSDIAAAEEAEAPRPVFYVDLETTEPGQARVSVMSVEGKPGVVLAVTGPAADLQPALSAKHYLDRAVPFAGSGHHDEFARQIRRARAAASSDAERDQIDLIHALNFIANGKVVDAEKLLRGIWPRLTATDKQRVPEPVRGTLDKTMPALEQAVRDRLTIKP